MRKFTVFVILAVLLTGMIWSDDIFANDSYFSPDKIDHFFTVMAISAGTSVMAAYMFDGDDQKAMKLGVSISVPLLFSIGKEVYDGVSGTGEVSYKDLIYDFAGLAAGILIVR